MPTRCTGEFVNGSRRAELLSENPLIVAFRSAKGDDGVKRKLVYGATDEIGFAAVENKVHDHG